MASSLPKCRDELLVALYCKHSQQKMLQHLKVKSMLAGQKRSEKAHKTYVLPASVLDVQAMPTPS
jgi:hypothetical protein